MGEREWFYNAACDWYDGPPVIEIRDGKKYLVRIPHMLYYNGTTNIPKVERVKMSKSFWKGFREGYLKAFVWTAPFAIIALVLMYLFHPYERCKRMYDNPNDIMECVWILEND